MTTHPGCSLDFPEVAEAYANIRGHRLILASLRDDDDSMTAVLDEMGDCTQCLRNMACFLAGAAAQLSEQVAVGHGSDRDGAIARWEELLQRWIDRLR